MTKPRLPGRLGDPAQTLRTDPDSDPRIVDLFAIYELVDHPEPSTVDGNSSLEEIHADIAVAEEGVEALYEAIFSTAPPIENVEHSTEVIEGPDGNELTLHIDRPAGATGQLPGVLHLHGGGMALTGVTCAGDIYIRQSLAAAGLVTIGVEFRNSSGKLGPYPFPAGLNDCAAALHWVNEHREELGIGKLIVVGESGGGNLALATALKAKRDGVGDQIDGVYALCPFLSGSYLDPSPETTSLFAYDGYFLTVPSLSLQARAYDPEREHTTNPLAWPLHAGPEDLESLPPHVISVNQLDPLCDEGIAYGLKLAKAGVSVVSRTVNGTPHAGDLIGITSAPEVFAATIRDIAGFANSL